MFPDQIAKTAKMSPHSATAAPIAPATAPIQAAPIARDRVRLALFASTTKAMTVATTAREPRDDVKGDHRCFRRARFNRLAMMTCSS
jgi:hypothetical protein